MHTSKFNHVATGTHCSIHSYLTDEQLTAILELGFFNPVRTMLRPHDRILIPGAEIEVCRIESLQVETRLLTHAEAETVPAPTRRGRGRSPKSAQGA